MGKVKNHKHDMINMTFLFGEFEAKNRRKGSLYRCNTCPYAESRIHKEYREVEITGVKL